LGTLRGELMKPERVKQFQAALNRQLGDAHKRANSSAAERDRQLAELDTEIDRMVAAVAEGLLSPALRTRLEAAEAERAQLRAATQPQSAGILSILPDALARNEKAIRELPATLGRDVDRARHVLKRLLGEIKFRAAPEGDALVAEIRVGAGALLRLVSNATTENCVGSGGPLTPQFSADVRLT
jgi:site-specific DNA recombinase